MNLDDNEKSAAEPKTRMEKRMLVMQQMIQYWKDCGFSDEKIEELLAKMKKKLDETHHEHGYEHEHGHEHGHEHEHGREHGYEHEHEHG